LCFPLELRLLLTNILSRCVCVRDRESKRKRERETEREIEREIERQRMCVWLKEIVTADCAHA